MAIMSTVIDMRFRGRQTVTVEQCVLQMAEVMRVAEDVEVIAFYEVAHSWPQHTACRDLDGEPDRVHGGSAAARQAPRAQAPSSHAQANHPSSLVQVALRPR